MSSLDPSSPLSPAPPPTTPRPIGVVTLNGGETRVELWGLNIWTVTTNGEPDDRLAGNLAAIYADRLVYRGPQDGHYGPAVLADLAATMGGVATLAPRPPDEPGVAY